MMIEKILQNIQVDLGLLLLSFVILALSIITFRWYNNGKGAPLSSLNKKIKFILALLLFIVFVFIFNLAFGNYVFLPLFNNCISTFIGFVIAFAFKNRIL